MSDPVYDAAREIVIQRGRYYDRTTGKEDPHLSVVPRVSLRRLDVALALAASQPPSGDAPIPEHEHDYGCVLCLARPPSGDALREALEVARLSLKGAQGLALDSDESDFDAEFTRTIEVIDAALATPPPLDVERVLAVCNFVGGVDPENPEGWRDFAIEFARAYAEQPNVEHQPWCQRGCTCGASEPTETNADAVDWVDWAGHRTEDPHDCFAMNCRALGKEVESLRRQLAARAERTTDPHL